jgi:predicted polyphosphate/ATP-dependent NAD kinase
MIGSVGFVVNPVAGIGGRAGHKGSDDPQLRAKAASQGQVPAAEGRAALAAAMLADLEGIRFLTWSGRMGEGPLTRAGIKPVVLGSTGAETTAEDTLDAARAFVEAGADVIVFVGGDGTARDIFDGVGERVAVVGVPAGVKMYSGVFVQHPRVAVRSVRGFLADPNRRTHLAEVLDLDEAALRSGRMNTRLYGYLPVPSDRTGRQGAKAPLPDSDVSAVAGIAGSIARSEPADSVLILGPGSTVASIGEALGCGSTLLGVDIASGGSLAVADGSETDLLAFIEDTPVDRLIVSPIGGQGFVLGRGNQQLSPAVLRSVGLDRIQVVASPGKLEALRGQALLVDTGDEALDRELSGWARVTVGPSQQVVYPIRASGGSA